MRALFCGSKIHLSEDMASHLRSRCVHSHLVLFSLVFYNIERWVHAMRAIRAAI
jgi:hypothetical protein